MKFCFLIFTTQHRKMAGYVESVCHLLPKKMTKHLWKDQEILVINLMNALLII